MSFESVLLPCASHQHSGPNLRGNVDKQPAVGADLHVPEGAATSYKHRYPLSGREHSHLLLGVHRYDDDDAIQRLGSCLDQCQVSEVDRIKGPGVQPDFHAGQRTDDGRGR